MSVFSSLGLTDSDWMCGLSWILMRVSCLCQALLASISVVHHLATRSCGTMDTESACSAGTLTPRKQSLDNELGVIRSLLRQAC